MQTFYDINFPLENQQAHLVESLIITCNGEAAFKQLDQFTNLKVLKITLQSPLPAPQAIGKLSNVEFLTIQGQAIDFDIIANLKNLKDLELIDIKQTDFSITASIKELQKLESLNIQRTNITHLPTELGELKELKILYLQENKNLYHLPLELCKLPKLRVLNLAESVVKELADGIFLLPNLSEITLFNNTHIQALPENFATYKGSIDLQKTNVQIGWATDTQNLQQFLANLKATGIEAGKLSVFFNLYAGYYERIKMPDSSLYVQEALNHIDKALRFAASSYWYQCQATPFPPKEEMLIHIAPTKDFPLRITDIEDTLKAQNVLLSGRMNQEVTHLIVGKKIGTALLKAQERNIPIVSMGHLQDYANSLDENVYLHKKDAETRQMAENLLNLLKSEDDSNVELGLQMALGGGLNDLYFYDILLMYIWNYTNGKQKMAGKILEKYLPLDVFLHITHFKWTKHDYISEIDLFNYLHKISQHKAIDRDKLGISFYEKFGKGHEFCLKQPQAFIWYCQKKRKNSVLKLSDLNLSSIPDTIADLKGIKILYLQTNALTELPDNFEFLKSLDTLNLDHNFFVNFPQVLLKMPRLASLSIANNQIKTLPTEISLLQNLETLNIANNLLEELPEGIYNLPALRRIEIGGTNPLKKQAKKIQEKMPYCKVIAEK